MDNRTRRLNEAFRASGLTQTELCNRTGINPGALSSYLSGRYFPKQRALERLADALNVPIAYLMGYEDIIMDKNGISVDYIKDEMILIEKIKKLSPSSRHLLEGIIDTMLERREDD